MVRLLVAALMAIVLIPSCNNKKAAGPLGLIPKESSVVISVNPGRLMDKLAKDGMSIDRLEESILGDTATGAAPKPAAAFWSEAKETGIDFSQPAYIAIGIPSGIQSRHAPVRLIASIADEKAFEAWLKKQDPDTLFKEKGIHYAALNEGMLGHDGKTAIYVGATDADNLTGMDARRSGFNDDDDNDYSSDSARKEIARSFKLSRSESITAVKSFEDMPLGDNDMRIWMNYETGMSNMMKGDIGLVAALTEKLFKGSSNTTVVNFENGKITMQSRMYFNKDASDTILMSPPRSIDLSLLDRFPGKRLNFFMGMAVEPKMIKDLMGYSKLDGPANFGLALAGLKIDDVVNAIGGDMMLVGSDFSIASMKQLMEEDDAKGPGMLLNNANVALLAKVKSRELVEKILASPKVAEKITREGDYYVMTDGGQKVYISLGAEVLVASASKTLIEQYNAGTAKQAFDPAVISKIKDKSMCFYMSMTSMYEGLPAEVAEIAAEQRSSASLASFFKEVYMTSGRFNKNYLESDATVVTGDAGRNSLASLVRKSAGLAMMFMGGMRSAADDFNAGPGPDSDRLEPMEIKPLEEPAPPKEAPEKQQ